MTDSEIRAAVLDALHRTLPDVTAESLRADTNLREQVDMDSIDFLRFLVAVHDTVGVDVPEADYPKLRTIDGIVAYLATRRAPSDALPRRPG